MDPLNAFDPLALKPSEIPLALGKLREYEARLWVRMNEPQAAPDAPVPSLEPTPGLLTVSQAAALLQLPEARVYRMIREGELPCIPGLGQTRRIDPAALQAWITSCPEKRK
ncbi:MAG TPA: helix-turn-helix domain-containing protein [Methylomirabilota bacterium]|nr:helix-turn-helix domain-containing protein [Methylomirabilota bacterium]